MMGKC